MNNIVIQNTGKIELDLTNRIYLHSKHTVFTLSTNSTSSAWRPTVSTTGSDVHWYVTGAVTTDIISNSPSLNFSTAGTKNIIVKSIDDGVYVIDIDNHGNAGGTTSLSIIDAISLTDLFIDDNNLTTLDISNATSLTTLSISNNNLTSLDVSNNILLESLFLTSNSLTNLDITTNTNLITLYLGTNNLTTLNISNNNLLTSLLIDKNNLTKTAIDTIMDYLISFGLNGISVYLDRNAGCADQGKVDTLTLQGWYITYDPCY